MKRINQDRRLIVLIMFSICTLGVFFFYHQHCKIRDINILCAGDGKRTPGLAWLIPLWICTFSIYGIVWNCRVASRLNRNLKMRGIPYGISPVAAGIFTYLGRQLGWFALIPQYKIIHATNALARYYNQCLEQQTSAEQLVGETK
jgi:hypothetical protein